MGKEVIIGEAPDPLPCKVTTMLYAFLFCFWRLRMVVCMFPTSARTDKLQSAIYKVNFELTRAKANCE